MITFAILLYCLLMTGTGGKELPLEKSRTDTDAPIVFSNVFTSTTSVMLKKAKENDKCCKHNYIESSEDGTDTRWPLVSADCIQSYPDCSCMLGGENKSFQEWVDDAADELSPLGLCIASSEGGWLYVYGGRLETCKDFAPDCDDVIKNEGGCGDEYVQYGCKKSCKLCAEG